MKKILITGLVLCSVLAVSAQERLKLKVLYQPSKSYKQINDQTTTTEVTYVGEKEMLDMLKSQGVKNPTKSETNTRSESELKTGAGSVKSGFPITIKFLSVTGDNQASTMLTGAVIHGKAVEENKFELDSITDKDLDAMTKTTLLTAMQATYNQISLPEKDLKVGDSFTHDQPLILPMGPATLDMVIRTTYTLKKIENGIAKFDLVQQYTMNSEVDGTEMNATGSGTGTMSYDIKNMFYSELNTVGGLTMEMNVQGMKINLVTNTDSKQSYVIK